MAKDRQITLDDICRAFDVSNGMAANILRDDFGLSKQGRKVGDEDVVKVSADFISAHCSGPLWSSRRRRAGRGRSPTWTAMA